MIKHALPKRKYARRFGLLPKKPVKKKPGAKSEYEKQLEEKQKLKFIYGVTEKQFRHYLKNAEKLEGNRGEIVLRLLETRLDNIIYRAGFAKTREQARQIVSHGHVSVDDKKVDIPSFEVRLGQKLILKEKIFNAAFVQENLKERKTKDLPGWLERKENSATVKYVPQKDDLPKDIDIRLVFEFYR